MVDEEVSIDEIISLYDDLLIDTKYKNTQMSELLPRLKIIGTSIKDKEIENWANYEITGYWDVEDVNIPRYRQLPGLYIDNTGQPIKQINNEFKDTFYFRHRIYDLERLVLGGDTGYLTFSAMRNKTPLMDISVRVPKTFVSNSLKGARDAMIFKLYELRTAVYGLKSKTENNNSVTGINALSYLHPKVQDVATKLFNDGHYRNAILDTYIALEQQVKIKSGLSDLFGKKLMIRAFSPDNPILKVSDINAEQEGYMMLFAGAISGVRNEKAHDILVQSDAQRTLEWLAYASVLFRIIDDAIIIKN